MQPVVIDTGVGTPGGANPDVQQKVANWIDKVLHPAVNRQVCTARTVASLLKIMFGYTMECVYRVRVVEHAKARMKVQHSWKLDLLGGPAGVKTLNPIEPP